MNILLTGGTGSVGKAILNKLLKEGDRVRIIGRHETADVGDAEYVPCSVTDFETLMKVSQGMDAVIHLAGVPSPGRIPPQTIFNTNVSGTFNVYEAASRNRIKRIVTASSINAFGFLYGCRPPFIEYFPLDEETPGTTTDVYSFSKQSVEEIGQYYHRRDGISGAAIRIPWVYDNREGYLKHFKEAPALFREAWDKIQALSSAERTEKVQGFVREFDQYRVDRYKPGHKMLNLNEMVTKWSPLMWGRYDFYTAIDERDCAQAFVKALKVDYEGAHTLFVNDSHNFTGLNTKELAELMYPQPDAWTGHWKNLVQGTQSLISNKKAQKLIGYETQYSLSRFAPHPTA